MLAAMCLSIIFMIVDTCSVLNAFSSKLPTGVEPFWKVSSHPAHLVSHFPQHTLTISQLSFIFKCLCDTVILDDFKTALDHLRVHWMSKKNGQLFVTPVATPNSSPRAYRTRRDIETGDLPTISTKGSYAHAVHMDNV